MNAQKILLELLKKKYGLVLSEVPIFKKRIDIVCFDNKELTAIEVKSKASQIPIAIGQCSFYKHGVHNIYIALPEDELKKISYERKILKEMGIGLISVSENSYKIVLGTLKNKPKKDIMQSILTKLSKMTRIPKIVKGYKALAHPLRLQIYLMICDKGEAELKDIVAEHGESYPLIIRYVKILEDAGLIESEKRGKETVLKFKSHPKEVKNIIKEDILELLKTKKSGLSSEDISNSLLISRQTVSKYLAVLEAEGRIKIRKAGKKKLHHLEEKDTEGD